MMLTTLGIVLFVIATVLLCNQVKKRKVNQQIDSGGHEPQHYPCRRVLTGQKYPFRVQMYGSFARPLATLDPRNLQVGCLNFLYMLTFHTLKNNILFS